MVNITRGQINNIPIADKLVTFFQHNSNIDGNLFLGYPVLPSIENKQSIDALLISQKYGIIAFIFYNDVKDVYAGAKTAAARILNRT